MSKMRRKPVAPPDFLADTPKLDDDQHNYAEENLEAIRDLKIEEDRIKMTQDEATDESIENADRAMKEFSEIDEQAKQPVKDLAKVMTNDQTPRCPFCLSPRLEPITMENPWGRKWVCNNCCTAFREPVQGKSA